jgi:NodT family efflux transporter outer membrane factor (OMF) lipoprotein
LPTPLSAQPSTLRARPLLALAVLACLCNACSVAPAYHAPAAPVPSAYKENAENKAWVTAVPADNLDRGPWWTLFGDPLLNDLMQQVAVSNQNVAAASAAYAQARSLVQEQRGALFPSVTLTGGATRSDNAIRTGNNYQLGIGGSWEPDLWGRLRGAVDSASASAQASAGDLASATLSAQGELAADYISLRQTDAQNALLTDTIGGYRRVLQITQNRYSAGIAAKTDVLQAQTQLANAQVEQAGLARQRAQLEHAIAVLTGKAPGDFSLASTAWKITVPEIPLGLPSTLLQRRPDIAAAERRVAAANQQIGIARAGYFPNIPLSASSGFSASQLPQLIRASSNVWSLGLALTESLFNGGATTARVNEAQAANQAAIAHYRQTVLTAFQQVEDQLAATRVLQEQQVLRLQASQAADQTEAQMLNRYKSGQVSYSDVVTTQVTALTARRALVQSQADQQTTAVALIQALGGDWKPPS